jgi:hypothetical protein
MASSVVVAAPADLQAEMGILGAVLLNNAAIKKARELVTPADFSSDRHRLVFRAMLTLDDRGEKIDAVTIGHALSSAELDRVGGPQYLSNLIDGLPREPNVTEWCEIVRSHHISISMAKTAELIRDAALSGQDVELHMAQLQADHASSHTGKRRSMWVNDFLSLEVKPRKKLLDPWLAEKDFSMVYGKPGKGKSWFALGLAIATSTGTSFLDWTAPHPAEVLFIDGEMAHETMSKRLAGLLKGIDEEIPDKAPLRVYSCDYFGALPPLESLEGQRAILREVGDAKLVIFDNLSSLTGMGNENTVEDWKPVQRFFLELRRRGVATLLIHHANKDGGQRGTSGREDAMNTIIRLERPSNSQAEGAHFRIGFDKNRDMTASTAVPLEINLEWEKGAYRWTHKGVRSANRDQAVELWSQMKRDGMPRTDRAPAIVEQLGIDKSTVYKHLKKAGIDVKSDD